MAGEMDVTHRRCLCNSDPSVTIKRGYFLSFRITNSLMNCERPSFEKHATDKPQHPAKYSELPGCLGTSLARCLREYMGPMCRLCWAGCGDVTPRVMHAWRKHGRHLSRSRGGVGCRCSFPFDMCPFLTPSSGSRSIRAKTGNISGIFPTRLGRSPSHGVVRYAYIQHCRRDGSPEMMSV